MLVDDRTKTLLKQIELFSDLDAEQISAIAPRVTLKEFGKGEIIFHSEDTNKFMYAVLRGEIKVFQMGSEGKEMILAFHRSGESFGELSLIDQLASPATVCATEDSIVAIIARNDFLEMIHSHTKILHRLLLTLTSRLRASWQQNRILHFRDATFRIRSLLENLSQTHGEDHSNSVILQTRLTHQCIADMTGLTRETVTRVIDKWKNEGCMSRDVNRRLVIQKSFFEKNEKT